MIGSQSRRFHRPAAAVLLLALLMALLVPAGAALAQGQEQSDSGQGAPSEDQETGGSLLLDPRDFNVFGRNLTNTGLGRAAAALLGRILVIVFDVTMVLGVGMLAFHLVAVILGRTTRSAVLNKLGDMGLGLVGLILIMTGMVAVVLNYLIQGGSQIQEELTGALQVRPPAAVAELVADGPHGRKA